MKTEWICTWQLVPGGKEQTKVYPTMEAAQKAMAKVLNEAVDLEDYINALRNEEGEDCGSSADFLEKYLTDLKIPQSEAEIPLHIDIPDHCLLEIHPQEGFRWGYMRGECPLLVVSHVCYADGSEPYIVDFGYENPEAITPSRVNGVYIRIEKRVVFGTSAYPLMILQVLENTPKTQDQIIRDVIARYQTKMDRKAVGRHLKLLQELGFPVCKCKGGYRMGD